MKITDKEGVALKKRIVMRLLSLLFILFGLSIMTFGMMYLLPSDPIEMYANNMGIGDKEVIEALRESYGMDQPFLVQYKNWLIKALHGDLGYSVLYNEPVNAVLSRRLPNTVKLACSSFAMLILISFPLGILSAVYKNKLADYVIRFMSFIGVSIPSFWFGMILIWIFGVRLKLLPITGSASWQGQILPTLTLGVTMSAYYVRRIRAVMIQQLGEDYIPGIKSRGVSRARIILRHVLPNSLLAVVTMLGMTFGQLLGGTMIVEIIFNWNGIGKATMEAITNRDYMLVQGYVLWMGVIYVMINLLVDTSYQFIDPRIRRGMVDA